MNKSKDNRNLLTRRLQMIKQVAKELHNIKPFAVFMISVMLVGIFSFSPVIASLFNNVTVRSSGTIATFLPLHVEGRYIKDALNKTILLRGVWLAEYADSCVGAWGGDYYNWKEANVRGDMQNLRDVWRVNIINTFIWGNWWVDDLAVTLGGYATSQHYRFAIKEATRIAQEYGLYFQIRLWAPHRDEGRVYQPYAPYSTRWTQQDFIDFWSDVATELKDYPNIIFTLYDEPVGNQTLWFEMATNAINAIRATGANNLVIVHWAYCGDCMWMERWINESRPTYNIVFSNHIYRYHGTFAYDPNAPTDINYIRNFLAEKPGNRYTGAGYKYIMDTYNIPIWVSAIGAYRGATNDDECIYFRNTLAVLNEWNLSYCAYQWFRSTLPWFIGYHQPNRVGQALIDAIAGIPPPPTYQLTINSEPSGAQFSLDGTQKSTPYTGILFGGSHEIVMPSSMKSYTHTQLFGNTNIGTGGGYYIYLYTAGPYTTDSPANVSAINLYTKVAGKARVAIYDAVNYLLNPFPSDWPHPGNLIVESGEHTCQTGAWNTISIPTVTLPPGTYFIAIKIDTNGMLTCTGKQWFGQFRSSDYAESFPTSFGTIEEATGGEYSVYVPLAPIQTSTYNFAHWEDNSTNLERTINLTTNMTLTATYELYAGS